MAYGSMKRPAFAFHGSHARRLFSAVMIASIATAWIMGQRIATCADDARQAAGGPTHGQERLITVVNGTGEKLTTFAVDEAGRVLAGVAGDSPLIRVYDPAGQRTADWKLPIPPEAINVGPKGDVFVAGQGKMLRLDQKGDITLERDSPNMAKAAEAAAGIHERVQGRLSTTQANRLQSEIRTFKKRLADMEQKIADVDRDLFALDHRELGEESADETAKIDTERTTLQKRRALFAKLQANLQYNIVDPPSQRRGAGPKPPKGPQSAAEPDPKAAVRQLIADQMRIASISASRDEVFFACSSSTGSGFDVWRTDYQFAKAKKIGESLRGCCGQLDVQANDNGIYVAENTRHRVSGFSREGRPILEFGSRERGRDDAFDGCCNPMNVAFGDDGSVYTAESGSGRIKRFSAQGSFKELVGQVELVPGCKKVSIAVSPQGDQVYMLDITRGHIVVMTRGSAKTAAASPGGDTRVAALSSPNGPTP